MIYKEGRLTNCAQGNPGKDPRIKSNQGANGGQSALIDCTMMWEGRERQRYWLPNGGVAVTLKPNTVLEGKWMQDVKTLYHVWEALLNSRSNW